jgi:hypothetical protein
MTTLKNSKPVLAEVLVRQVFGEQAESFERVCAQRGVNVADALGQALRNWVGHGLTLVRPPENDGRLLPANGQLPDPADCPFGQEEHWLQMCEHDLKILRGKQQACFQTKDTSSLNSTNLTIEAYLQTMAEIRSRVA